MEPNTPKPPFNRQIRWIWNSQDGDNPFEDPDLLKQIQALMNEVFEHMDQEDNTPGVIAAIQAELDHLEDVDDMVIGEHHPIALNLIMNAYRSNQN